MYLPLSSSNTSIPRDQQSAELSWPLFRMISGATYSGVPQNVHVFLPRPTFLAKPKSTWAKETFINIFLKNLTHISGKRVSTPAWRILGGPGWCSQVWGLCRWFLWSAGKPEPLWRSPCRSEWCRHQMIPCSRGEGWRWHVMVCQSLTLKHTYNHRHNHTPVSQQRPQLSSEARLQQHVEIFRVSESPIQPAGRQRVRFYEVLNNGLIVFSCACINWRFNL